MRNYELVFICHPDLDDNAVGEIINKISGWISEDGGKVTKLDHWGKRTLAYLIRKQSEGHYIYMDLTIPPSTCAKLERNLRIMEPILRYSLIVN